MNEVRRWLAFGALTLAAARLGADGLEAGPRWALSVAPNLPALPGVEMALEHRFARRSSLRLIADYRPRVYNTGLITQQQGGGLGLRWYWTGETPMAGLYGGLKGLVYHVDDEDSGGDGYVYSLFGGGAELGYQFQLSGPWRVNVYADLAWLLGDKAYQDLVPAGSGTYYSAPTNATTPGGRIHLTFSLGFAYAFE